MIACGYFQIFSRTQGVDSIHPGDGPGTGLAGRGIPSVIPTLYTDFWGVYTSHPQVCAQSSVGCRGTAGELPARTTTRNEHGRRQGDRTRRRVVTWAWAVRRQHPPRRPAASPTGMSSRLPVSAQRGHNPAIQAELPLVNTYALNAAIWG
jgi:hypothetical protein